MSRGRVLVVDDAAFMRRRIRDVLEGAGYEVVGEAADGEEALALYESARPDVVTLDLVMPHRDGLDTLRELRRRDPAARVVVCSSLSDEASILEAIRLGARDYLVKPVAEERLLEAVDKARR